MPQLSDQRSFTEESASLSPLPGRRLFMRLASPFSSKSRSISEFYVDLADPHRQYSPGDIVNGSVRLKILKPLRVTHLVVSLHGFVQVHKNPGSPQEIRPSASYLASARGKKAGEYFGNGFASLFEDEVVLCGDGRLAEGSYQFNFELEFPDQDLPSSIDFERGTVTYMITSTLTKPTPIAPTLTCDQKVIFVERIDIASLPRPRARTITLEPLTKRARAKGQARKLVDSSRQGNSNHNSEEADQSRQSSGGLSLTADNDVPRSPSPSVMSMDSMHSSLERGSQPDGHRPSQGGNSDSGAPNSIKTSVSPRTISATMECLQGGGLRGDILSTRVNVVHAKPVRSLYGVIVTLYRHARVDMHPDTPLRPTEKGTKSKFEDYYPKSATGLGGLSLTGHGASHTFRKDLTQTIMPLYVDPISLTTEVHARVRVPEDLFPTISTVPGGLISFKYYIEVVLDIQGKLTSQDRSFANLGGLANPGFVPLGNGQSEGGMIPSTNPNTIVDTTQIRRDKGVVTCSFEVVVGTLDSGRKGKQKLKDAELSTPVETSADAEAGAEQYGEEYGWHDNYWYYYPYGYEHGGGIDNVSAWQWDGQTEDYRAAPAPHVPLPQMPEDSELSEKERIRRHEERLLPSRPPGLEETNGHSDGPSAPYLPDEAGLAISTPAYQAQPPVAATSPRPPTRPPTSVPEGYNDPAFDMPAVPEYSAAAAGPSSQAGAGAPPTDDKQELERRILEQQASAPPMDNDEPQTNGTTHSYQHAVPSVPSADEAGPANYDSHADATPLDEHLPNGVPHTLPRYEAEQTTGPS